VLLIAGLVAGCSSETEKPELGAAGAPQATRKGGAYKVGRPYQIKGVWYTPRIDYDYVEDGVASWYGPGFDGKLTANGEIYDQNDMTAAHRTLPLPTVVRVTNLENGRSIKVRINDRGPFARGRIIDLSRRAAQLLGFYGAGTAMVRVEVDSAESRELAIALTGQEYPQVAGVGPGGAGGAAGAMLADTSPSSRSALPPAPLVPTEFPTTITTEPLTASEPVIGAGTSETLDLGTAQPVVVTSIVPVEVAAAGPIGGVSGEPLPPPVGYFAPQAARSIVPAAPPTASRAYVQAGVFSDPVNADRARRQLAAYGPVEVLLRDFGGRSMHRVRLGPVPSDSEAGRLVEHVVRAGFPGAHIVEE
jgi:rare lipoprotein A